MSVPSPSFIERWQQSAAAERANYALFLSELCDFLEVPRPEPTRAEEHLDTYVFEKPVTIHNLDGTTSTNFIDLYRRNHFVLEAKQGSNPAQPEAKPEAGDLILTPPSARRERRRRGTAVRGTHGWDEAMLLAYNQAEHERRRLLADTSSPGLVVRYSAGAKMDNVSKEQRSRNMASIGARHTGPEKVVRGICHRLGYRFRLHTKRLPGSPDLVFPRMKKVVFVHGCFWHRHANCDRATTPASNTEFWQNKFRTNLERDKRVLRELRKMGWEVMVIWQCQLTKSAVLERRLARFLAD